MTTTETSARAQAERRYTEEGAKAPPGAPNPHREGTAAHTWWQRGHYAEIARQHAELLVAARLALECIEKNLPPTTFAPREMLRGAIARAEGLA